MLMHKNMQYPLRLHIILKNFGKIRHLKRATSQCHVFITMITHATSQDIMVKSVLTLLKIANPSIQKRLTLDMVNKVTLEPEVQKYCNTGDKLNILLQDVCVIVIFVEILYIVNTKLQGLCGVTINRPAIGTSLLFLVLLL